MFLLSKELNINPISPQGYYMDHMCMNGFHGYKDNIIKRQLLFFYAFCQNTKKYSPDALIQKLMIFSSSFPLSGKFTCFTSRPMFLFWRNLFLKPLKFLVVTTGSLLLAYPEKRPGKT